MESWNILSWKESSGIPTPGSAQDTPSCSGQALDHLPMDAKFCVLTHEAAAPHLPRDVFPSGIFQTCCCFTTESRFQAARWESLPAQCRRCKGMKTSGFCLILVFGAAPDCAHQSPPWAVGSEILQGILAATWREKEGGEEKAAGNKR